MVAAPVSLLPSLLEVIALAHIRSAVRYDSAQLIYALMNALRSFSSFINRWFMTRNSRIGGVLSIADDGQREGGQHGWIHRGSFCSCDRIGRRSCESLIEVQFDT